MPSPEPAQSQSKALAAPHLSQTPSYPTSSWTHSSSPHIPRRLSPLVYDLARQLVELLPIPVALKGGLSGAADGFAEIYAQSIFQRSLPSIGSLANQSAKLFFYFGTYTYLSIPLSPELRLPKSIWYCWLIGSTADGFGSGILARLEGIKVRGLWKGTVPTEALTTTVTAVHITACAEILPLNRFIPVGRY